LASLVCAGDRFTRIALTANYAYIYISSVQAFIIPSCAFDSSEAFTGLVDQIAHQSGREIIQG
jgi:hypothetical protein